MVGVVLIADTGSAAKLASQVNDMLVHAQTGARVVGTLADDPAGAEQLAGRRRGRLDKSLLIRTARKVTADLYQQYGAAWSASAHAAQPHQPHQPQQPQHHQSSPQQQGRYAPSAQQYQPGQPGQPAPQGSPQGGGRPSDGRAAGAGR